MLGTPLANRESPDAGITDQFLAHLPRFRAHARFALRHIHSPEIRADLLAETIAIAWKHFVALTQRGKDPTTFIAVLALRCSQAVRGGRRLAGSESMKDVMSPVARVRHGFAVGPLDDHFREDDDLTEALADNTQSEVPEQAAFRIDFPRWRRRFGSRNRRVLNSLMVGEGTGAVAARFGMSPARVSQLRQEFKKNWDAFHNEEVSEEMERECA
jgi:DNA-directed RNA polymerase specialized sigma24 family protein